MSKRSRSHYRLTVSAVTEILLIAQQRANLMAQLRALPNAAVLARKFRVSRSTIFLAQSGKNKKPAPDNSGLTVQNIDSQKMMRVCK